MFFTLPRNLKDDLFYFVTYIFLDAIESKDSNTRVYFEKLYGVVKLQNDSELISNNIMNIVLVQREMEFQFN
jgi:hypothetical protein